MLACKRVPHYCADTLPKCITVGVMTVFAFINAILNEYLNVTSDNYWSSTTNASDSSNAWNVNFNNGNDNWNDKTNSNYVRCVRSGE